MQYLSIPILAAAATVLIAVPTSADLGDQLFKLLPDDGAANDYFGKSVAISGTTVMVGAFENDDNGSNSGTAYIFDITTGQQIFNLTADDGASHDLFGCSVAISGTTAIVGAYGNDDNGSYSGSAYIFDTTTGQQLYKLLPSDNAEGDVFGRAVAISGTTAIVGANDDENGIYSGSAYLFDTITGEQIIKLLPDDVSANDRFGVSVAIDGTIAIVGAMTDSDNGENSGSAYLFDSNTGEQMAKLLPDDGEAGDQFGKFVAISGHTAIVGARYDDDNGDKSGSAYLFDTNTGKQIAKLLPDDGTEDDRFGSSVAINTISDDQVAIVGANYDDDNGDRSGSAYFFDARTGQQIAKILPSDGAERDQFGNSVAISGSTGIVGAWLNDDNGSASGSAYIFDSAFTPSNCPWDLDNSGSVGTSDLLELFTQWGTDGPADFDGSGAVGTGDLLILFANWGPCE